MRRSSVVALGAALMMVLPVPASAQQTPAPCQFIRDFKRLHDLAPDAVGGCASRRIFTPNGDVVQYTVNGLIVRRKADNWTAFTDGHMTFIDGPAGLVSRRNGDHFPWEHENRSGSTGTIPEPSTRLGPSTVYPNSALTPGATDPRVSQRSITRTICAVDYASRAQPSATYAERVMARQLARYHYSDTDPTHYVLDHFVPIELGGDADAPSNMWPEPLDTSPGPAEKDRVESYLRDQVCAGNMTLATAQQAVLNDWIAAYKQLPSDYIKSSRGS